MARTPIRPLAALVLALGFSAPVFSQIGNDKLNFTLEATLPSGRANPVYRAYLNGLVNIQPKLQYKVYKDWFVAAGPKYSYYTVSEFKVPTKMKGGAHTYGGFVEAGWSSWQTPRLGIELSVKGGLAQTYIRTTETATRNVSIQRVNAAYVEPTFSLILAADEAVAYRWVVGYNISGYDFKPYHVGIPNDAGYTAEELNKPCQSLIVGFAFSYYFGNQRSDVIINE